MTIQMPPVRQVPSPNYSPTPIRHDLIIAHRTEGGYAGSVAWLCDRRANASAHLVMKADGSEVTQLVPLSSKAWAQCAFNSAGVSLEIEGFTAQGMSDETMQAAAKIVAWLCHAYAIPCQHAVGGQGRGVTQHHDLGAAGGGHVDCFGVADANWQKFMAAVKAAYDELAQGLLPPFALHGAPNPAQTELPPAVAHDPSHGGAARNEPGDVATHNTPSGWPTGSIGDWQYRLRKVGANPTLGVDNDEGGATDAAIATFQRAYGLLDTGKPNPQTWAALEKATA